MIISTLLMILTLAVGPATSQSVESNSTTYPAKIASHCWINGVWYNPCPTEDSEPSPEPSPEIQTPS
jgi:hypothetical protein